MRASAVFSFVCLLLFVLLVNCQVIYQDLMFPEQPMLYLMNQKIHSAIDLLAIYLHPQMLDWMNVPFFRPSGHFLLYQIISPLIGWHNTRGLLVVNFIFLTLMGLMMVKVYELLFPRLKTGGYIAFAICVMHPLFILSRFTIMHFEYASIFFLLASLYCFMIFCQKNIPVDAEAVSVKNIKFKNFNWLIYSLLFYFVAATFKEAAIMLMPALPVYLYLRLYGISSPGRFFKDLVSNKEILQLSILLMVVGALVAAYLSLAWIAVPPVFKPYSTQAVVNVLNKYMKIIFSYPYNFIPGAQSYTGNTLWEICMFPWLDSALMLLAMLLLPVNAVLVFSGKSASNKRSLLFLYCCVVIFLLLPVMWNHAMPWHAGLSLVFLSLSIGYAIECLFQKWFAGTTFSNMAGYSMALLIGVSTILVNQINFQYLLKHPLLFNYKLARNAIKHPPLLSGKLNNETVLVVEDSMVPQNDYQRGDSVYPFVYLGQLEGHRLIKDTGMYVFPYVYGGTLFRWAYANSQLKEQIYPFQLENMAKISADEIIYNWLQHYNNIYCVGFDNQGQWHDKTAAFKKNLLREQLARHMIVHQYQALPATALTGKQLLAQKILLPDSMVCKQFCDKIQACKGFTYFNTESNHQPLTVCKLYQTLTVQNTHCAQCTGFIKERA